MRWVLRDSQIVHRAIAAIHAQWAKAQDSGKPLELNLNPENVKRSSAANRYYWDILRQISEQAWHVQGAKYSTEAWHEFAKREFLGVIDLPNGGQMGESTSGLNTKEFAEYVQELEVWAATELNVRFIERNSE